MIKAHLATLHFTETKIAQKLKMSHMKLKISMERYISEGEMHTASSSSHHHSENEYKPVVTTVKNS